MTSATQQIRTALALEGRQRTLRSLLLMLLLGGLVIAFVALKGLRHFTGPHDVLAQAVGAGFILFGLIMPMQSNLHFGAWAARAIAAVALVSPLLAMSAWGEHPVSWKCMMFIVAGGLFGLTLTRLVLGATRRRFGGAAVMQGVAAAMASSLAISLHCSLLEGIHLLTHILGALIVVALVRPLLLPN